MYTVQAVIPFVYTATIRAVLRRPEYSYVNISIVHSWQSNLAEEVQAVGGDRNADRLEVAG